jgi:hypothetical protein
MISIIQFFIETFLYPFFTQKMEILYIDVDWKEFMIASNETSIAEKSRE